MNPPPIAVHRLGVCEYQPIATQMRAFTRARDANSVDQLWLLQHHPVFTRGVSCKSLPRDCDAYRNIPIIDSDRGGQMTYHAPGQVIVYLLLDLKRRKLGAKSLVAKIESAVIALLRGYGLSATRRPGAPGVYVDNAKIAALGLRVSRGCCFHGVSVNVDMDLRPYECIDPCGFRGLGVTRVCDFVDDVDVDEVGEGLVGELVEGLVM